MNLRLLFLTLTIFPFVRTQAQPTRYFEFGTSCGHNNWQDTTFVAAASNPALIDSVLANMSRPINQRKFITGPIDYGNGGYNRNATHWFKWHFIPDQWTLTEMAIELCDGCPYSDLDADTAYWVETVGSYCPWTGYPLREVAGPSGLTKVNQDLGLVLSPNPAADRVALKWSGNEEIRVELLSDLGQRLSETTLTIRNPVLSLADFPEGIYLLKIATGNSMAVKKLLINGNVSSTP